MKTNSMKSQKLFSCYSLYAPCQLSQTIRRGPVLAAQSRKRIMLQSLPFSGNTQSTEIFPLNFQPCLHSKKSLLTEVSEFQELQNFCHFVCNSFHLEKGSETLVTRYSERESFPNTFLCVENKRERKEYVLADTAVFKKDLLVTRNTAEL